MESNNQDVWDEIREDYKIIEVIGKGAYGTVVKA